MKISLGDFIVPVIVVGALGWWGYTKWSERTAQAAHEKERIEAVARDDEALAELGRRFQATAAPTSKLVDLGPRILSYQVQNALHVPAGTPVVVSGNLMDLALSGGQYVLLLEDRVADSLTLRYVLQCPTPVGERLIAKRAGNGIISAVTVFTAVEREESPPAVTTPAPQRFIARGQCLDAVAR